MLLRNTNSKGENAGYTGKNLKRLKNKRLDLILQYRCVDRRNLNNLLATMRLNINNGNNNDLNNTIKSITIALAKYLPCWAVTSLSTNNRIPFEPGIYDLLIIDEASQCDIAFSQRLLSRHNDLCMIKPQGRHLLCDKQDGWYCLFRILQNPLKSPLIGSGLPIPP